MENKHQFIISKACEVARSSFGYIPTSGPLYAKLAELEIADMPTLNNFRVQYYPKIKEILEKE